MTGTARPLVVDRGRTPRDCRGMRTALACTAMLLVASRAFADDPLPPLPQPAAPQPDPSTKTAQPPPQPEEPKADPAYGDKPDLGGGANSTFSAARGHD